MFFSALLVVTFQFPHSVSPQNRPDFLFPESSPCQSQKQFTCLEITWRFYIWIQMLYLLLLWVLWIQKYNIIILVLQNSRRLGTNITGQNSISSLQGIASFSSTYLVSASFQGFSDFLLQTWTVIKTSRRRRRGTTVALVLSLAATLSIEIWTTCISFSSCGKTHIYHKNFE